MSRGVSPIPTPRPPDQGPRPTRRQVMGAVLDVARATTARVRLGLDELRGMGACAERVLVLAVTPQPGLGLLIRLPDWSGPQKAWLSTLPLGLFLPILALVNDVLAHDALILLGLKPPGYGLITLALLNVYLLFFLVVHLPARLPRGCRRCGWRALLLADQPIEEARPAGLTFDTALPPAPVPTDRPGLRRDHQC